MTRGWAMTRSRAIRICDLTGGTLTATSSALYNYGFANFAGFPNTHDAGLIVLEDPIDPAYISEYGQLPEAGMLDSLATKRGLQKQVFTVSGYGLTYSVQEHSALSDISFRSPADGPVDAGQPQEPQHRRLQPPDPGQRGRARRDVLRRLGRTGLPGRSRLQPDRGSHVVRDELAVSGYRLSPTASTPRTCSTGSTTATCQTSALSSQSPGGPPPVRAAGLFA